MKCPACHNDLQMTDRQGIEIDYCPQCRGVWLDRGELDKLIERSAMRETEQRDYRESSYQHGESDAYPRRKKKSLWREVFDFD